METPLPLPQGLRRLFSPQVLVGALRDIVSRFTLTFVFACLDTLYCIFFILFPKVLPDITETAIVEALALGTLLTLASYLWGEYFGKKKFTAIALTLSVMAPRQTSSWLYYTFKRSIQPTSPAMPLQW